MNKAVRVLTYSATGVFALCVGVGIGAGISSPTVKTTAVPSTQSSPAAPPSVAVPVVATPSPDGTYQGACAYSLGSDPVNGTAVATGDVNVTNTGNIGAVFSVVITWPQQGYSPLKMTKTVKIPAGGENDVQFHTSLTEDQLTNLQNWQTGHGFQDGCTYNATITDTYGSVQS